MYSPFRHAGSILAKRRPIHLTFFVTRRCNSKCPFCFYLRSSDSAAGSGQELTLDEIRRISASFGNLLWLAFSGGEIYLREDLVQIARVFYENNKPAIMLFPTNGLLPELIVERTRQILKECPKSVITVKLSLDGLREDHDEIRKTPGSFSRTMETYELLAPLLDSHPRFELGINTVFCSANQGKMDEVIDFVAGLRKIKTHTVSLVRGDLEDEGCKAVNFGKYLQVIQRLERRMKKREASMYRFPGAGIKAAQDILQRRLIHRTIKEQKRLIPCYAGRLNLVLTETGVVYPCEILTRPLGNVRDCHYDIKRLLQSSEAKKAVGFIKNGGCYCTHECYFMTNILFNPALYPDLLSEYLQIRSCHGSL
jgi:MoaA/NifB/PqqE/SkfB family radical SAM enzyme